MGADLGADHITTRAPEPCLERGRTNMKGRIAVNPQIHFGKPCVAGIRVFVQDVLELVREDLPFAQIIQDYYPNLEIEGIRACIRYAIDVVAVEDIRLATTL